MSVEHAYKHKHDLFPLLTHEVGNQLTVIKGYAELLLEGIASLPVDTSRQFAEAIVRTAGHMGALIESVSDLHRLDLGTMEVQPIELDLVSLVRETLADMARQLGERSVDVVLPDQLHVFADPVRTRQILTNLKSNAAKFSPTSATVAMENLLARTDVAELRQFVHAVIQAENYGVPVARVLRA